MDAGRPADDAVGLGRRADVHARLARLECDYLALWVDRLEELATSGDAAARACARGHNSSA